MKHPTNNTVVLEANNVSKSFDNCGQVLEILRKVNLKLYQKQSIAIVGESGSGKSTLLSLLSGLDMPNTGNIRIYDNCLTQLNERQRSHLRAKHTGFIFQSFYLLEDLTALENIALPMELLNHPCPKKSALLWLKKMGLANRANHFPKQLSGGEKQRVAIGRAFAVKPDILFADEPTASLDYSTAKIIIEVLFSLHKECKNSLLLVTHDQQLANRCDTIYQMQSGGLYEI